MKKVVALMLAGGRTEHYGVLTRNRPKAALTFAANYRVADFALSNLCNSHIEQIGIIIQYLPGSLIGHVGVGRHWDLEGYGRVLKIMPPFVGIQKTEWYKGTADALHQNMNFVEDMKPEHVIVLSGEHVYHLDFADVARAHRGSNADITFVTRDMPAAQCAKRYGYVVAGRDGRVTAFREKPATPPSTLVSTGIYVFKTGVLASLLEQNAPSQEHNLARDVLEPHAGGFDSRIYMMPGNWEYMETVKDYYDLQFRMMFGEGLKQMRQWRLLTNLEYRGVGFKPPVYYGPGAQVTDMAAGAGCHIEGTVERSILSPGVRVGRRAIVRDSILMHDCVVEEDARVCGVIADKDARFMPGCRVGAGQSDDSGQSEALAGFGGLTLVGKGAVVPENAVIPRGAQIQPKRVFV
ncbi:MAG: sugar phosphate nucleotidyltransferase [bacterium]|nr:sugar phosphate nucleotidyltransferase [Candidatus Sumerlaeota bacterium]